MGDQTLFRDPDIFEITHLPETFNYRDAQVEDLAFALRPAVQGFSPLNTVLRGPPGTGKTTAVRRLFAEVRETTQRVVPVLVSCQTERTANAVYSQIFLAVFGHMPPRSGIANERILDKVAGRLVERKAVLVVCLDDANYLIPDGTLNRVLAAILRMHEAWPGARTGVFLTISDLAVDLFRVLNPATLSVLHASDVYFIPYNTAEIREILSDRIGAGLYPGVVPPAVLEYAAERTYAYGDLRVGLDMVKRAALAAEADARREVTAEDMEKALQVSRHLHVATVVRNLSPGERAVLNAVLAVEGEGRGEQPATAGAVYARLRERERIGYTTFHERLRKLEHLHLVDLAVRQEKGRTRVIEVREGVEEVISGPVSAGSSGASLKCPAGVCDDEKCGYEGGRR